MEYSNSQTQGANGFNCQIMLQCGQSFHATQIHTDQIMGNRYTFGGGNVETVLPPFLKGVHSKRKEFAPLFRMDLVKVNSKS